MAIAFSCMCGRHFQVADALAGKRAKCPCGTTMTVPTPEAATVASADDVAFHLLTADEPRATIKSSGSTAAHKPQQKAHGTAPTKVTKTTQSAKPLEEDEPQEDEPQEPSVFVRVAQQLAGITFVALAIIIGLVAFAEMQENAVGFVARLLRAAMMVVFGIILVLKGTFGVSAGAANPRE